MPEFSYTAARADGQITQGVIQAGSREMAVRELQRQGLIPTQIERRDAVPSGNERPSTSATVPVSAGRRRMWQRQTQPGLQAVSAFTRELAIMLRAGLPLDRALRIQTSMQQNASLHSILRELLAAVKSGQSLSQALSAHQALFGDFYINMLRSGEASGQLAEVLERLAEHMERMQALRESVISALIYPAILLFVSVLSVILMLGFVVPQFESLFDDMGEALPVLTRLVIGLGQGVEQWGWMIASVVIGLGWGLRAWVRNPAGQLWWHRRQLGLPLLGDLWLKFEMTRFTRSMGTLIGNGVPIVTAIRIAADTVANANLRQQLQSVVPEVKQGQRLATALEMTAVFTPLSLNMVRLGEETGRLDQMLLEVARIHDQEVQSGIKRLLVLIEPVLILTLGALIAVIIVAILMGILSVNELAL